MKTKVTPLRSNVLIERIEEAETVKNQIIIPDSAKEKPQEGTIVAVGLGQIQRGQRVPLDVKVGDRVLFGKYSGHEIRVDGELLLIIEESEIQAILGKR